MIFNGYDFSPYFDVDMKMPFLPPVDVSYEDVSGRDGTVFTGMSLEALTIPVKVRLKSKPKEDMPTLRRELAEMLYTEEPAKLILPDDDTRWYMAILRGPSELSTLWYTGTADLEFYCPDPIAYGEEHSADASANDFRVGGSYPTKPVITAKPAAGTYFRITNYYTGEYVQLTRTFAGTETLVIDCLHEQTTLNGTNTSIDLVSNYFEMAPGNNRLARSSGSANAVWNERWL